VSAAACTGDLAPACPAALSRKVHGGLRICDNDFVADRSPQGRDTEPVRERVDRFVVSSVDGTPIGVWVDGDGPPLVLVHGAFADHTRFDPLVAELRDHLSTFAMDRRGRGASGDAADYSIELEFDDVAAVVDAVAARTGRRVALWGHSYGADCAMGGAARTDQVSHLVLYEPGLGSPFSPGQVDAVETAVAVGDEETAIRIVVIEIVGGTEEDLAAMRASPIWPSRIAALPTMPREIRAEGEWVYGLGQFDHITVPTVVMAGSMSPAVQQTATRLAVEAIPGAEVHVLEGHGHFAIQTDPAMVAAIISDIIAR
jgi:pimeloyl-ACP methyl ester carboxylesterase